MSAFLQSNDHIDALIRAGLRDRDGQVVWIKPGTNPREYGELTPATATEVGRMLQAANVANLVYLYEDRLDEDEKNPPPYEYDPSRYGAPFTALQILHATAGFEYQCCDTVDWDESEAKAFCEALRKRMVSLLPGYGELSTWSI